MNKFSVLTLFPEIIEQGLNYSITGRAIADRLIELNLINIRDFAVNKYGQIDDKLYGGGTGMLMMPEPILAAWLSIYQKDLQQFLTQLSEAIKFLELSKHAETSKYSDTIESLDLIPPSKATESLEFVRFPKELILVAWQQKIKEVSQDRIIYLSPKGKTFNQQMAQELSQEKHLVFLCGHYEGVDQRILDVLQVEEVSLGDFVLTGGEPALVVMIDAISRLIPGVLPNMEAHQADSHSAGLLEEPQYTRPANWHGIKVPDVLLSGHQANIENYRKSKSLLETYKKRPDLLQNRPTSQKNNLSEKLSEEDWLLLIDSLKNN
ncbi:MAG: tRNA (guanine(37)-N(1))-methyltransferase [Clostridiaceae bacterium]|nr:tRNA (guanine(37)-N(1))-methyltransferase [Clostridiaceae bacterium]